MNWKKGFVSNKVLIERILNKKDPTEAEQVKVVEYFQRLRPDMVKKISEEVLKEPSGEK